MINSVENRHVLGGNVGWATRSRRSSTAFAATAALAPKPSESHSIIRIELRLSSALSAATTSGWKGLVRLATTTPMAPLRRVRIDLAAEFGR
jgi:hypothetical protein